MQIIIKMGKQQLHKSYMYCKKNLKLSRFKHFKNSRSIVKNDYINDDFIYFYRI